MSIIVTSPSFAPGQRIPVEFTGEGADVSPELSWTGAPSGTVEFALICDDPDAPTPQPWVHWLVYGIPANVTHLPQGIPRVKELTAPAGARQGLNSWTSDNLGYRGPMPPPKHGVHHYHFRVYALSKRLGLPAGVDKPTLLAAMKGLILAEGELVGTYER